MTGSNYASITESRSSRNTITALQKTILWSVGRVNATGQARPPWFTLAICSNISFDGESPCSRIWTFPSDYHDGTPPAIHLDGTSASGSDDLCSSGDVAGQHPLVSDMACCFYCCTYEVLPRSRSGGKKCYFLSSYKPTP